MNIGKSSFISIKFEGFHWKLMFAIMFFLLLIQIFCLYHRSSIWSSVYVCCSEDPSCVFPTLSCSVFLPFLSLTTASLVIYVCHGKCFSYRQEHRRKSRKSRATETNLWYEMFNQTINKILHKRFIASMWTKKFFPFSTPADASNETSCFEKIFYVPFGGLTLMALRYKLSSSCQSRFLRIVCKLNALIKIIKNKMVAINLMLWCRSISFFCLNFIPALLLHCTL